MRAEVLRGEIDPLTVVEYPFQVITNVPLKGVPFALKIVSRICVRLFCASAHVVEIAAVRKRVKRRYRSLTMRPRVRVARILYGRSKSSMGAGEAGYGAAWRAIGKC